MTTKNNDETTPRPPEEIVIAKRKEYGKEILITGEDFKEGIQFVANALCQLISDLEESKEIKPLKRKEIDLITITMELLRHAMEEMPEERLDGFEKHLQTIYNAADFLTQYYSDLEETLKAEKQQFGDPITRFLHGEIDYMMSPRPRGYDLIQKINSTGEKGVQIRIGTNEAKITFYNRFGIEEKKLLKLFEMALLEQNFHGATKNLDTLVRVRIDDVMGILGRPNNPSNKRQFRRRLYNEKTKAGILEDIANSYLEVRIREAKGRRKEDDWIKTKVGQTVGIVGEYIVFRFSEDYARYINTGQLRPFPKEAYFVGSRQFPLPYYVQEKLLDQYFSYWNRERKRKEERAGTHNILKIQTLLDHCKETIDYSYILENDPTHWKRDIKEKYERALNEIQDKGVFKWEYCGAGMKEIPQAEIDAADFRKWSKLYITFQYIPKEPEQEERLQRRRERIEAAIEKKQLEDDKVTVEAEKIRKRRRRKKAPKEAQT